MSTPDLTRLKTPDEVFAAIRARNPDPVGVPRDGIGVLLKDRVGADPRFGDCPGEYEHLYRAREGSRMPQDEPMDRDGRGFSYGASQSLLEPPSPPWRGSPLSLPYASPCSSPLLESRVREGGQRVQGRWGTRASSSGDGGGS